MTTSRARRAAAELAALAVAGWLLMTGVASAHDGLVSSTPADGESVDVSPGAVELEFSGTPQVLGGSTAVVVTRTGADPGSDEPAGEVVSSGALALEGKIVRQPLQPALADGEYTVAYRVVSSDGHEIEGTTTFYVGPVPAASTPSSEADSGGGVPVGAVVIGLVAGIAVVLGAALTLGRARRRGGGA